MPPGKQLFKPGKPPGKQLFKPERIVQQIHGQTQP